MRAPNVTRVIGTIGQALVRGRPPSRPPPPGQEPSTSASAHASSEPAPATAGVDPRT